MSHIHTKYTAISTKVFLFSMEKASYMDMIQKHLYKYRLLCLLVIIKVVLDVKAFVVDVTHTENAIHP